MTAPHSDSTVTVHRPAEDGDPGRVAPHLFLALECSRPGALSARASLEGVDTVVIGRGSSREAERRVQDGRCVLTIRVPDASMSHTHVRLERGLGQWMVEDAGSKNGTLVNGAPVGRARLADGDLITLGYTLFLFRAALTVRGDPTSWLDAAECAPAAPGLATLVPELDRAFARLVRIAPSEVSITIRGETGTGKEILARAVHGMSRRSGDFVAINCGALTETLLESELFGHKKGAFSGATEDSTGLVRMAHGGTLLLDEIGDLPATSQAAFLRVLQEREVMAVGGTRPIPVDLRVISATHRDIEELVAHGRFRSDLLARVSGFRIDLPPLRERREDLGLLIGALIRRLTGDATDRVTLSEAAARALFRHDWPHNVRELEKVLGAAIVLAGGGAVDLPHLAEAVRTPALRPAETHDDELRVRLVELLTEHAGNISAVARATGKARMQIHRWMRRFGIVPEEFRR
jgi:transcriptional regulator with AAA-type ATPase domain